MQTSQIIQLAHIQDRWHIPEVAWVSIAIQLCNASSGFKVLGTCLSSLFLNLLESFLGLFWTFLVHDISVLIFFSNPDIYIQVMTNTLITGLSKAYPLPLSLIQSPLLANNRLSPSLVFLICSSGRLGTMVDRLFMHEIFLYSYKKRGFQKYVILFLNCSSLSWQTALLLWRKTLFSKNVFLLFLCFPTFQLNVLESRSTT